MFCIYPTSPIGLILIGKRRTNFNGLRIELCADARADVYRDDGEDVHTDDYIDDCRAVRRAVRRDYKTS